MLARRLASPATDPAVIAVRLDAVTWLLDQASLRADLRVRLGELPDFQRSLSRLSLDRGGPRDLAAIRRGMEVAMAAAELLGGSPDMVAASPRPNWRRHVMWCGTLRPRPPSPPQSAQP